MTKYALYKATAEIPYRKANDLKEGVTYFHDQDSAPLAEYATEAEALAALNQNETWITNDSYNRQYYVEEYYVEIHEYDEDGDMLDPTDIVAYTPMRISVVDEDDNVLSVHDNYVDARAAYRAYEGDKDIEIKFN